MHIILNGWFVDDDVSAAQIARKERKMPGLKVLKENFYLIFFTFITVIEHSIFHQGVVAFLCFLIM